MYLFSIVDKLQLVPTKYIQATFLFLRFRKFIKKFELYFFYNTIYVTGCPRRS